ARIVKVSPPPTHRTAPVTRTYLNRAYQCGRSGGRLQGARGGDQLVDVGQLARLVGPCATDDSVDSDEKRAARGYVPHAVVFVLDAEAVGRIGVPVGQEREVEVERLHP